ncbi:MAG: HAD family phosphatase [Treponema sp.]|jgi:HAD superfamily hydrolase (TIGR01490 family)|nr:HAD family phosphatase [Treponema sp.]
MIHIFDVDNTVIKRTSAWYFLLDALKEKLIKYSQVNRLPVDLIKYKLARPDNDFIENVVKNLAGIKKSELERIAEICFENRIKDNIYTGIMEIINDILQKGERAIFATSSFDFIVYPLEKFLKIEGSLATKMEYNNGCTTGLLSGESLFGVKKKEACKIWMKQNNIDPKDTCFYSDSYTDIPLLEYCGIAVAVNPDRILKKEAKKRGWKILRLKETGTCLK